MSSVLVAASVLLIFNLVATFIVIRHRALSPSQRAVQIVLVWVLPVLGGIFCLIFAQSQSHEPLSGPDRRAFADNAWSDDDPPGAPGLSGSGDGGGD